MIAGRSLTGRDEGASPPTPGPVIGRRGARVVLAIAIVAFVVQGWFLAGVLVDWSELLAQFAAPLPRQLVMKSGTAHIDDPCGGRWLAVTASRPSVAWCAGGLGWPILVTPYIGGIHYWPLQLLRPLHHGDPVALRRLALPMGIVALIVVFLLVERLSDSARAATSVSVAAALPGFLILHALPVFYELMPSLLIAGAALVVVTRSDTHVPPTRRRAAVAGLLAGLGVLANVKGVVIAVPALGFAWRQSAALRRTSRGACVAALTAASLAVGPMVLGALVDPEKRFGHEIVWRLSIALSRLRPGPLVTEGYHLIVNAADLGSYFDVAQGGDGNVWLVTLVPCAVASVYCVRALWRAVRGMPHDVVAAGCGALQMFFLGFVWLSYNQIVASNYTPITYVFAVSLGCAVVAVARRLGSYSGAPRASLAITVAVAVAPLLVNTYRRDHGDMPLSINVFAERALGSHLQHTAGGQVVVTTNALVGVPEAFTGVPSVRLDLALSGCQGSTEAEDCRRQLLVETMRALPQARFIVPLHTGIVDKSWEQRMVAALTEAAATLPAQMEEEARFTTRNGEPVLGLMRVTAGPSR